MTDTDARLAEAIEMVKAATPGPLFLQPGGDEMSPCTDIASLRSSFDGTKYVDDFVGHTNTREDGALFAFAGTHLPTILTALAAYRAALSTNLILLNIMAEKNPEPKPGEWDWPRLAEDTRAALAIPIFADEVKA